MTRNAKVALAILLCALLFAGYAAFHHANAKAAHQGQQKSLEEFDSVKGELATLDARVRFLESRRSITNVSGVVQAVEQTMEGLGLKDRLQSVKELPGTTDPSRARAEVLIKKADLNETVNLLYALDNAPMLMVVEKFGIKKSFEDPQRLDLTLTIALLKPQR